MRASVVVGVALALVVGGCTSGGSSSESGGSGPASWPSAASAPTGSGAAGVLPEPSALVPFDFDGDGFADLAVGVPEDDMAGAQDVGSVQVLYGSASGPTARDQVWHQGVVGVRGAAEGGDLFGYELASGDFDGDGFADLAIGIPGEDIGTAQDAGAVQALFGGPSGLGASGNQVWHQGSWGVPGRNETSDRFGESLGVGDFDGDGYADLAVGVPGEDLGATSDAGHVVVLRGSTAGLASAGTQVWSEASAGVATRPRPFGSFGDRLAAGDVNGDGRDDLAIGVLAQRGRQGAVHLLLGGASGLAASGSQYFVVSALGLGEWLDTMWLCDANGDDRDDLLLGANSGVALLHGFAEGVHPGPLAEPGRSGADVIWSGYRGPAACGDLTGDGYADVAMIRRAPERGIGLVVGTSRGVGSEIAQWPRRPARDVNLLPLGGGPTVWLVLGAPNTAAGRVKGAGAVTVLRATPSGAPGSYAVWHRDSPGIKGVAKAGESFGWTVGG